MLPALTSPRAAIDPSEVGAAGRRDVEVPCPTCGFVAEARGWGAAPAVSPDLLPDSGRDGEAAQAQRPDGGEPGERDLEPRSLPAPAIQPVPLGTGLAGHPLFDPGQHRLPVRLVGLSGLAQTPGSVVH